METSKFLLPNQMPSGPLRLGAVIGMLSGFVSAVVRHIDLDDDFCAGRQEPENNPHPS